jgi:hypothetical protein
MTQKMRRPWLETFLVNFCRQKTQVLRLERNCQLCEMRFMGDINARANSTALNVL